MDLFIFLYYTIQRLDAQNVNTEGDYLMLLVPFILYLPLVTSFQVVYFTLYTR